MLLNHCVSFSLPMSQACTLILTQRLVVRKRLPPSGRTACFRRQSTCIGEEKSQPDKLVRLDTPDAKRINDTNMQNVCIKTPHTGHENELTKKFDGKSHLTDKLKKILFWMHLGWCWDRVGELVSHCCCLPGRHHVMWATKPTKGNKHAGAYTTLKKKPFRYRCTYEDMTKSNV